METMMRAEHPRPDFQRPDWLNLNGTWQFAFDERNEGVNGRWFADGHQLDRTIQVPFCYQSELSGVHDLRFCDVIWYKRTFCLPETMSGKRILLTFGAVDFRCWV